MSDKERKELNLQAGRLIKSHEISFRDQENIYDELRDVLGFVGYAHYYIRNCWDESELKNKADVEIYKRLLEIDSKLGTTQSEQLRWCLCYSPRKDFIEV